MSRVLRTRAMATGTCLGRRGRVEMPATAQGATPQADEIERDYREAPA